MNNLKQLNWGIIIFYSVIFFLISGFIFSLIIFLNFKLVPPSSCESRIIHNPDGTTSIIMPNCIQPSLIPYKFLPLLLLIPLLIYPFSVAILVRKKVKENKNLHFIVTFILALLLGILISITPSIIGDLRTYIRYRTLK